MSADSLPTSSRPSSRLRVVALALMVILIAVLAAVSGAGLAEWRMRAAMPTPVPRPSPTTEAEPKLEDFDLQPATLAILQHAQTYELLSLEPVQDTSPTSFHGYRVLGRTVLKDRDSQANVNKAIITGAAERRGIFDLCMFNPRHGLHVVSAQGTADLVICFQCGDVDVFQNEKQIPGFPISHSPEPILDALLVGAGVELAKKAG